MHRNQSVLRFSAAAVIVVLLASGTPLGTRMARADVAPAEPAGAATLTAPTTEAFIDATAAAAGALRVSIVSRGMVAGPAVWRCLDGQNVTPTEVRLVDANGSEASVSIEGNEIAAAVTAGDWTLTYVLSCAAPTTDNPLLVIPGECLLLPPESPVKVTVTVPDGWTVLANSPGVSQNMDGFRLRTARFLLAPDAPRIIASVGSWPAETLIVAAGPGVAWDDGQGETLGRLVSDFTATVPSEETRNTYLFVTAGATVNDIAFQLLDAMWAGRGPRVAQAAAAPAQRLVDDGVWPLLRDTLLGDSLPRADGLFVGVDLARSICDEYRSYRQSAADAAAQEAAVPVTAPVPALAPPLASAPLASLYFVARELGGAKVLFRIVAEISRAEQDPATDFVDWLAVAIANGASAGALTGAVTASGLLLRLAGRVAETAAALPDLPTELLAVGDPDRDDDGLPDRLDEAPDERGIAIQVAGKTVRLDVAPLNINGRIMVPLRFLAERLGLDVAWDGVGRIASVGRAGDAAAFPVGTHYYVRGGMTHYLDAPTIISGDRTMVSLRFVAKALNVGVSWDGVTRTVNVIPDQAYIDDVMQPVAGRTAYLTFDDGPEPGMTPQVLAVLKEYGVRATFFILGSIASRQGELLRRIVSEGHAIGNHTYTHDTNSKSEGFVYRSPTAYLEELASCDRAIAAAVGIHPRASRPPGGSYPHLTEEFRITLRAHGYLTYDWDVSAADSALPRPTTEQVLTNIMAGARDGKRSRLVVLMHDGGREHQTTLAALPAVIEYLRACGYDFGLLAGAETAPADNQ